MLPKIGEKTIGRDIPYHSLSKQLPSHTHAYRSQQNTISKLKLLKQFYQDELCQNIYERQPLTFRNIENITDIRNKRVDFDKQNSVQQKKIKRQSVTSQTRTNQNRQRLVKNKEKQSIFTVPDRVKLNELFNMDNNGKARKSIFASIISSQFKMNSQLYTHRIL